MSSVSSSVDTHASGATSGKLTLLPLIALVVGSMIGGGVFNLPSDMSKAASPGAIMIGWAISGFGMLMLAFVYQSLAVRKPKLNAGPYAYARAGFGDFVGFNSAWGYWLSAFLGNVAYAVAIFSALSYFIPAFEGGNNLLSIVCASVLLWGIHFLVLSGVKQAAFINVITTVAKLVPIMLFILLGVLAFNLDKMNFNFWGAAGADSPGLGPILEQVRSTMLVTLWVFIGIEGASVYSERAANRADVGRATVIGFLGALAIYVLVSLIATGIMTQAELAGQKVPSMAGVFEQIVGPWGAMLINIGLIVSVGGVFLAWTLLCAEVPYAAGKDGTFPSWFAKENANGSPVNSLWVTNGLIQLFLIVSLWSEEAYQFFYFIASVAILPPYVLSGAYAAKLAITGETYEREKGSQTLDLVVGALATIYGLWLVYAAGLDYLLMNAVLFAPGILVFWYARSERGQSVFKGYEMLLAGLLLAAAAYAGYQMYTGALTPL